MNNKHWTVPQQIWQHPNPSFTRSNAFRRWINHKHGLNLKDSFDLHDYSVSDWTFWADLWDYLGIIASKPFTQIIEDKPLSESPQWFIGARLNYAENLLLRNDDDIACTQAREHGPIIHYTFRQLREMVRKMANAMKANGLTVGDRVAAIVTNSIDPLIIMLGATSIGAIYSGTATDMGVSGILDRYRQIKPKLIFSESEVIYAGRRIDLMPKLTEITKELRKYDLEKVIVLPSTVTGKDLPQGSIGGMSLTQFLEIGPDKPLTFEQLPFSHPAFILYSSGTSGPPKCIVHCAGGVLLQTKKDYGIAMDVHYGDTFFQYTTTGWMMWTAMVACQALGARNILYDGSPFHPDVRKFLKFINDQRITHFGTSPRFLSELQGRGIHIRDNGDFEGLRVVMVTGAVLTPASYIWTANEFPRHTHVLSGSGGTDVCTAFVGACTALPGYAGEMQTKCLGMKIEVFDEEGKNIEHMGAPGELVCTRAHPSLPLEFWGDVGRKKLTSAYFTKYPGVWTQGDFMVVNPLTRGIYVLGRSDGVLNPSGIRFGSGEVYNVMEKFASSIDDCLCIGQRRPQDDDERVLLFVKMREGSKCDDVFQQSVRSAIKTSLSSRHVPAYIFEVTEIPYTVNNKKIEIAVKQIVSGSKIKPSGTVANPESLQQYYKYFELEKLVKSSPAKAKL